MKTIPSWTPGYVLPNLDYGLAYRVAASVIYPGLKEIIENVLASALIYLSSHASDFKESGFETLTVADLMGQSAKYKGFAEQCMAEYDLDGWTASDPINPDDVSVLLKKTLKTST